MLNGTKIDIKLDVSRFSNRKTQPVTGFWHSTSNDTTKKKKRLKWNEIDK